MTLAAVAAITVTLAGCAGPGGSGGQASLTQAGSSTVLPLAEAWAESLAEEGVYVTVAGGGSGAGASQLCAGEIDLADLSREMKESEAAACRAKGVEPVGWEVAFDGLTVVLSKENTFVDHLTVDELRHIWRSDNPARTWADVRAGWPAEPIVLYGPDSDSGTYEFFNEEILGKDCGPEGNEACAPRSDYQPNADDNVLVEGVASNPHAIGHFGFAYFAENEVRLRAVPIQAEGAQPVGPSFETIVDGSYRPLSRPLYIYTDGVPAEGDPVRTYLLHVLGEGQAVVRDVGYVELDAETRQAQLAKLGA